MASDDPAGRAEWRSAGGKLVLGHCRQCDSVHYYPRAACPFCASLNVDRAEACGQGQIYSHSFTARGPDGAYILAYVTLDEGLSMLTNIIDCAPENVAIGQRVELVWQEKSGEATPYFRPRA